MVEGKLFFFNKNISGRPIEDKYDAEVNGVRESFEDKKDAILFLFDRGVRTFNFYTKEIFEYKKLINILRYEIWQIEHRIGYVLYDYEPYVDEQGNLKKRKAYVWRFVGFGRSCFASTREELKEKVKEQIKYQKEDPKGFGLSTHPCYTKYYR